MMRPSIATLVLLPCIAFTIALCGCPRSVSTLPGGPDVPNATTSTHSASKKQEGLLVDVISKVTSPANYKVKMSQSGGDATSEFIFYEDSKLAYVIIDTPGNRLHIDYQKNLLTAYDKDLNRALVMPMDDETRAEPPFMTASDINQEVHIDGVEEIGGIECWRVHTTMPTPTAESQEVTAWIDTTYGLIRKLESKGQATITFEYSDIGKLDRKNYALPEDVTMIRVGDKPQTSN